MQKDTGFNAELVTYLYAIEVQYLIENGAESNLPDIQEVYDIPDDKAAQIIELSCKRYISQLLNFALRSAKRYEELDSIKWMDEISKYAIFVSDKVDADGTLFNEEHKSRLIEFYEASLKDRAIASNVPYDPELAEKLRDMINVTDNYIPPVGGIEGLLGNVNTMKELSSGVKNGKNEKWAWG